MEPHKLPRIIAFYSDVPQSGKTECAKVLEDEFGYTRLKFAQPIRDMVETFMDYICPDMDDEHLDYFEDEHKAEPLPVAPELDHLGALTVRRLMQTLGTEWGRGLVHPNIWTDISRLQIERFLVMGGHVVIDDLRFENEFEMLRTGPFSNLTVISKVTRPTATALGDGHISEGRLGQLKFDHYIQNSGSLSNLRDSVWDLLATHQLEEDLPYGD